MKPIGQVTKIEEDKHGIKVTVQLNDYGVRRFSPPEKIGFFTFLLHLFRIRRIKKKLKGTNLEVPAFMEKQLKEYASKFDFKL